MPFIGIDQSLNGTGICVISDEGTVSLLLTIEQGKDRTDHKLLKIKRAVLRALPDARFAAMEDYSYHSVNRSFTLGEVGGTVKLVFLENDIPYVAVAPVVLKMFATGSSSAGKDEMILAAEAHGIEPADDNQADAFFLARVARAYTLGDAKKRCEMEAIHSLRTSNSGKQDKPARRVRRVRRLVKNAI